MSIKSCVNELGARLLIIDAGSTDGTTQIIDSLAIEHRLIQEEDDGLYFAWNKAIELVNTDFMFFLNADDTLHGSAGLEALVNYLNENDDYICASGMTKMIRRDGKIARRGKRLRSNRFYGEMPIVTPATVFRRSCLQQIGGFDTSYSIASDYDLAQRLLAKYCHTNFAFIECDIVNFSIGGMSNTQLVTVNNEINQIVLKNYGIFGYVIHRCLMSIILIKRTLLNMVLNVKKI